MRVTRVLLPRRDWLREERGKRPGHVTEGALPLNVVLVVAPGPTSTSRGASEVPAAEPPLQHPRCTGWACGSGRPCCLPGSWAAARGRHRGRSTLTFPLPFWPSLGRSLCAGISSCVTAHGSPSGCQTNRQPRKGLRAGPCLRSVGFVE